MDLQNLDKNQLKALFLNINAEYLKVVDAPIANYINSPEFLNLRKQLHEVMSELDKRRMQDPPIIHESSPRGLEPNSISDSAIFFTE